MENKTLPKEIVVKNFKVAREDIVFIKAILESYEGMVVVRTVEGTLDILELLIAADFEPFLEPVLQELQAQVMMQPVELAPRPLDWLLASDVAP